MHKSLGICSLVSRLIDIEGINIDSNLQYVFHCIAFNLTCYFMLSNLQFNCLFTRGKWKRSSEVSIRVCQQSRTKSMYWWNRGNTRPYFQPYNLERIHPTSYSNIKLFNISYIGKRWFTRYIDGRNTFLLSKEQC